jgi:hypothetical protein
MNTLPHIKVVVEPPSPSPDPAVKRRRSARRLGALVAALLLLSCSPHERPAEYSRSAAARRAALTAVASAAPAPPPGPGTSHVEEQQR